MARRVAWWWKVAVAVLVVAVLAGGVFLFLRWRKPSPSAEAFCSRVAEAQDLDTSFARLDLDAMERQVSALRSAAEVAPPEVAPQVRTVLDLTVAVADAVARDPSEPSAAVTQVLRDRREQLPVVTEAGQAVERYAATTCNIQLGSDQGISGSRPS